MTIVLHEDQATERTLRVFLESEPHGREFFDGYDTIEELVGAVKRLTLRADAETEKDGVERIVGIAIVPKCEYGSEDGYGHGLEPPHSVHVWTEGGEYFWDDSEDHGGFDRNVPSGPFTSYGDAVSDAKEIWPVVKVEPYKPARYED